MEKRGGSVTGLAAPGLEAGPERRHGASAPAAARGGCETQAVTLESRPAAASETPALEKKQHVTLRDVKWSRPKLKPLLKEQHLC